MPPLPQTAPLHTIWASSPHSAVSSKSCADPQPASPLLPVTQPLQPREALPAAAACPAAYQGPASA
eukprot:361071-Chlamydomonas_euryale.AAC.1